MTISCVKNNHNTINKLIITTIGTMCTYDSLGNPQLSLRLYLEYCPNEEIRIAKGDSKYVIEGNAPPYSLDRFFKINDNDSLLKLIDNVLKNKTYKDLYMQPGEGFVYVILFKTPTTLKQIVYRPDSLPDGLKILHSYYINLSNSSDLVSTKSFLVDSLFINYEKQQFAKYPPPPAPSPIDSTIKFVVPIVVDTIN